MDLSNIPPLFNRALILTFERTKWFLTFLVLSLCGILIVFCRGLAEGANPWISMSLTFLPLFLLSGFLLASGVVLIRVYHDEVKQKEVNYPRIIAKSLDLIIGASYFTIPFLLAYLVLWMMLGIFLMLSHIPGIGSFFAVLLAFAPFLIYFATILLCLLVVALLFFATPIIALKGLSRELVVHTLSVRLQSDLFSNLVLLVIALLPILIVGGFLTIAAFLTGAVCPVCVDAVQSILQWFFVMIPFAALLAPTIVFFFNFAAEAHVFMQKRARAGL